MAARERRRLAVPLLIAAVAVTALAGLLLGTWLQRDEAPAPPSAAPTPTAAPSRAVTGAGVRLEVPPGWAQGKPSAADSQLFRAPVVVAAPRERLSVAAERLPAASQDLLPTGFARALGGAPRRADRTTLGAGLEGWRYRFLRRDRAEMLVLYVAPTTHGIVTVACTSPPTQGIPAGCAAVAGSVSAPGERPVALGPSAAFLSRLTDVTDTLDAARAGGRRRLAAAPTTATQAAAASGLASSYWAAAATLRPLAAGLPGRPAAVIRALNRSAAAYAGLAAAARRRDEPGYARAGRAVSAADARLSAALAG